MTNLHYMAWLDLDPKRPVADKLAAGAARYAEHFGERPRKDARRQEEWSIRAELARALERRAPQAEPGDMGIDDVADEEGVSDLVSDYQRQRQIGEERSRIYAEMQELYN